MVRAAASGAIDYSRADPRDTSWRIRHRLIIREVQRRSDEELFNAVQRHWLAYVAHGRLTEEAYTAVRERADKALTDLQGAIYPWIVVEKPTESPEGQKDTIDPATRRLIERFKSMRARLKKENDEKEQGSS